MSALTVGLTGGLASGKSTVARMLAQRGLTVIDADQLVHRLYAAGGEGAKVVAEMFGHGVLSPEGDVDRQRLAAIAFADADARRRLESAIHPLVRRAFEGIAAAEPGIVVLEATLLVEAGYAPGFDVVVNVEADPELRLARAVSRGMAPADARARLEAQGDGAERRAAADLTLRNDGDLAELEDAVDRLVEELRSRAGARPPAEPESD